MADLDDAPDLIPVIPPGNHVTRAALVDWAVANDMAARMLAADKSMKFLFITSGQYSFLSFFRFLREACADNFTLIQDNNPIDRMIFEKDGHHFECDVRHDYKRLRGVSPNILYVRGTFVHKKLVDIVFPMLSEEGNEAYVVNNRFGRVRFINLKDFDILKRLKEIS